MWAGEVSYEAFDIYAYKIKKERQIREKGKGERDRKQERKEFFFWQGETLRYLLGIYRLSIWKTRDLGYIGWGGVGMKGLRRGTKVSTNDEMKGKGGGGQGQLIPLEVSLTQSHRVWGAKSNSTGECQKFFIS